MNSNNLYELSGLAVEGVFFYVLAAILFSIVFCILLKIINSIWQGDKSFVQIVAENSGLLILAALIGLVSGYSVGVSRDSAVGAVIPAILTLVGALITFTFTRNSYNADVSTRIICSAIMLNIAVFFGLNVGAEARYTYENTVLIPRERAKIHQSQAHELLLIQEQAKQDVWIAHQIGGIRSGIDIDMKLENKDD